MKDPLADAGVDWHDLPISRLSFTETGIVIDVTPYNESTKAYDQATLSVIEPAEISLDISSTISLQDLAGLEIADFQLSAGSGDRLSGVIGIIPDTPSAGYWEIRFKDALIKLKGPNSGVSFLVVMQ